MIVINLYCKTPIFEQIKKQIIDFIYLDILKENDKLPSVRTLAIDLGINPNTVARSYQELEEEGYIYSLNKKGYYIASKKKNNDFKKNFQEKIIQTIKEYHSLGLSKEEINKMLLEVIEND